MTKPREFWITKRELRDYKAHLTLSSAESTVRNASPNFEIEIFKVVEVSALEALQAKLDTAIEALKEIESIQVKNCWLDHGCTCVFNAATFALAKIEGEK